MDQPNAQDPQPQHTSRGATRQTPCGKCGADLRYEPGTTHLACKYCGHTNPIAPAPADEPNDEHLDNDDGPVTAQTEQDFHAALASAESGAAHRTMRTLHCDTCGASVTPPPVLVAYTCPYCDSAILAEPEDADQIAPQGIIPFDINAKQANTIFQLWVGKLWFAPNKVKRNRQPEKLKGIYVPYWTFDTKAVTTYTGKRGDHYYTTVRGPNGTTRRQQHTSWKHRAGVVTSPFNDILVLASNSLPLELTRKLEPWKLKYLQDYDDRYVSGFLAERYGIDLEQGFGIAQIKTHATIDQHIRLDIGGDVQRITTRSISYQNITFKHILLPIWVSAYRYNNTVYRFVINGQTGEVQGERPYSPWKIAFAILGGLVIIAGILIAFAKTH